MSAERRIERPTPTLRLLHEWRHRGRTDVHGFRELKVSAQFSNNEDAFLVPVDDDCVCPDDCDCDGAMSKLPNEIVVTLRGGQDRSESTIRLPRAAADELAAMLQDALQWDGR